MTTSAFTVSNIKADLSIDGAYQRFILGDPLSPQPLGSFKVDNIYVPAIGSPSFTNSEIRNHLLSGYRWIHETQTTDTNGYGSLILQRFLTASSTGITIMSFNDDGTFSIPGVSNATYIIQTADSSLPNAQVLGALTTGIIKNTTTTGILSIATNGTDYYSPGHPTTLIDDYNAGGGTPFGNLGVGTNALQSLVLNSSSNTNNTAIGPLSLKSFTTGSANTAVGKSCLPLLISGSGTTAVGVGAGLSLTSTANDCFFGLTAGQSFVTSSGNCLFGFQAGAGGQDNLQSCSFFGAAAGASASNLINSMALGAGATVGASATIVIGNSSITNFNIPGLNFGLTANTITSTNTNGNITLDPNGTGIISLSANVGIGTTTLLASLHVLGGIQNVASEDSTIRAVGSSNATKIEINNTSASGRLYELRSDNAGNFAIADRTGAVTNRFTINSSGNIGIGSGANAPLQFAAVNANRKIVFIESSNNDNQVYAIGAPASQLRFQVAVTTSDFVFFAGTSSSTSNEVARIKGTGILLIQKILGNTNNTPSASAGTAAGSSPTLTVAGSELSGTFTVVAGTTPSGTTIATFTLSVAMSNTTYGVTFTPANQATASLATQIWINVTSTTQFTISCLTALVATTTYKWNFHIIGC